jgi:hypothetical protein
VPANFCTDMAGCVRAEVVGPSLVAGAVFFGVAGCETGKMGRGDLGDHYWEYRIDRSNGLMSFWD